ncbi:MAG: DUF819 family protein [Bacteroidota bacterium]
MDGRPGFPSWLSSIVACYGVGILVSNLRLWQVDQNFTEQIAGVAMLVGLPLLLFAVRLRDSLRYARSMLIGFGLCCFAGLLCTALVGWFWTSESADGWKIAGMLTGLYTGGTPNVQAIGLALDAPANYLVLIQAADILLGGAYLLGLISFLPAFYGRFFPAFTNSPVSAEEPTLFPAAEEPNHTTAGPFSLATLKSTLSLLGLAILCTGLSLGVTVLLTGGLSHNTLIILLVTSFGLILGSQKWIRNWGDPYPLGEYFILIFCVALGLLANFHQLAKEGMELLYFSAMALGATTLLHLLLCYLFRLDRDTVILSSVAGLYGPVFVVQVAAAIKNKKLLAAGLAVSLLGFGIGNYLGLGVAYLLRWLI